MMKDIARKIKKSCEFMTVSEIVFMLKSFELNRPHLILDYNNFRVRNIIDYECKISKEQIIAGILQLQCFDKSKNQKKVIEVILAETVKYGIDQLIQHVKQCKQLIRKDLTIEIQDSYFLDDFEILYVIEYEHFEHFTISTLTTQQDPQIQSFMKKIVQYLTSSISPNPSFWKHRQLCEKFQFGLIAQVGNPNYLLKFNPIDTYIFQKHFDTIIESSFSNTDEVNSNMLLNQPLPSINSIDCSQEMFIHRDRLIRVLKEQYPQIYDSHGEAISKMLEMKPNYHHYSLIRFDENCIELSAETDEQIALNEESSRYTPSLIIILTKYLQQTEAEELMSNYQKILELKNIEFMVEKHEIINLSNCYYIYDEKNQKDFDNYLSVVSQIKEKFLEQFEIIFNSKYAYGLREEFLRKINILEQILEIFHTLNIFNIGIEYLYIHKKTSLLYLSTQPDVYQSNERQNTNQKDLRRNVYLHYISEIILRFELYFSTDQNNYSNSFQKFQSCLKKYLIYDMSRNNNQQLEKSWLKLKQIVLNLKQLITINTLNKLYFKFPSTNLKSFEFIVPEENISPIDTKSFLQIFKENNNITKIKFEGQGYHLFNIEAKELCQLQTQLADTQPNLQSWDYFFLNDESQAPQSRPDYFNLAQKPFLNKLCIFFRIRNYSQGIYLQIKNNKNQINTLQLNFLAQSHHHNQQDKQVAFRLMRKLKKLVCLKWQN